MVKTYFITQDYENDFPPEFAFSLNKKYVSFQYCLAVCNEYIDAETAVHADFIQRDNYCDSMIWHANSVPIDQNRKYEYIGTKRKFRVWFTDSKGNEIKPDRFTLFLKLEF